MKDEKFDANGRLENFNAGSPEEQYLELLQRAGEMARYAAAFKVFVEENAGDSAKLQATTKSFTQLVSLLCSNLNDFLIGIAEFAVALETDNDPETEVPLDS